MLLFIELEHFFLYFLFMLIWGDDSVVCAIVIVYFHIFLLFVVCLDDAFGGVVWRDEINIHIIDKFSYLLCVIFSLNTNFFFVKFSLQTFIKFPSNFIAFVSGKDGLKWCRSLFFIAVDVLYLNLNLTTTHQI